MIAQAAGLTTLWAILLKRYRGRCRGRNHTLEHEAMLNTDTVNTEASPPCWASASTVRNRYVHAPDFRLRRWPQSAQASTGASATCWRGRRQPAKCPPPTPGSTSTAGLKVAMPADAGQRQHRPSGATYASALLRARRGSGRLRH